MILSISVQTLILPSKTLVQGIFLLIGGDPVLQQAKRALCAAKDHGQRGLAKLSTSPSLIQAFL